MAWIVGELKYIILYLLIMPILAISMILAYLVTRSQNKQIQKKYTQWSFITACVSMILLFIYQYLKGWICGVILVGINAIIATVIVLLYGMNIDFVESTHLESTHR